MTMPAVLERARGNAGADVVDVMHVAGEALDLVYGVVGLVDDRALGRVRHHEVGFDACLLQHFEDAQTVDRAACSGNSNDQLHLLVLV
jgi:hypothetical protein